jgi:hypothetical protein
MRGKIGRNAAHYPSARPNETLPAGWPIEHGGWRQKRRLCGPSLHLLDDLGDEGIEIAWMARGHDALVGHDLAIHPTAAGIYDVGADRDVGGELAVTCTVAPFAFSSSKGLKSSGSSKSCVAMMRILPFAMAGMGGSSKLGAEESNAYMAGAFRGA